MPAGETTRSKPSGFETRPVPRSDKITKVWDRILATIWNNVRLPNISMIGCFVYGPERKTTIIILLDVKTLKPYERQIQKQHGHIRDLLVNNGLSHVAVAIEKGTISSGSANSTGTLNDQVMEGPPIMGQSLSNKSNTKSVGTLGGFFQVRLNGSRDWQTVAMTCWHVVAAPEFKEDMLKFWEKTGIRPKGELTAEKMLETWKKSGLAPHDKNRFMLAVDHPGTKTLTEALESLKDDLLDMKDHGLQLLLDQDAKGEGEFMGRDQKGILKRGKDLMKRIAKLEDYVAKDQMDFGTVFAGSGIRTKMRNRGFVMQGDNTTGGEKLPWLLALDWALVQPNKDRVPKCLVSKK